MRVEKNCGEVSKRTSCRDLAVGTVFNCEGSPSIHWLKLANGYLGLESNAYWIISAFNDSYPVHEIFPRARIVLE